MSRKLFGFVAGLLLLLAGCTNDDKAFEQQDVGRELKSFTSFTATLDGLAVTRAYLVASSSNGVRRAFWEEGDVISVYSDTDTELKEFVLTSLSDGLKATFTGEEVSGHKFYAIYAPEHQYTVDTENPNVVHFNRGGSRMSTTQDSDVFFPGPIVSLSTDNTFVFKQTTGIIQITVGNVHRIRDIVLNGNKNEPFGENSTVDLSEKQPVMRLDAGANIVGFGGGFSNLDDKYLDIYFFIPPMVLENGFCIEAEVVDKDGNELTFKKSYNSKFEVKVGTLSKFSLVDISAELKAQTNENIVFADPIAKQICIENWDTNGDGELGYDEAAAVTDIGTLFRNNSEGDPSLNLSTITKDMKSFNEFQYFTGVKEIQNDAFSLCLNLESIILPKSVTAIGDRAFINCSNLTELGIPDGVRSIGSRALSSTALKRLHIPASLISFGSFGSCYSLDEITVDANNPVYDSREDCNAIIETATNTLLYGCNNTTIPSTVTKIADNALSGFRGFTSDNLDLGNVTSVGAYAFSDTNLTGTLNIPTTLTEIGKAAFGASFTSITVAPGNPVFDSRNNCNAVIETTTNTLLIGCSTTQIPADITAFGYGAFSYVKGLDHVDIPSSVTDLGEFTFGHSDIKSVSIPEGVATVPASMFHLCPELESVSLPSTLREIGMAAFNQNSKLKNINFPEGLTKIGNYAFSQCFALTAIELPSTLESLGSICFNGCYALSTVIVRATTPPALSFSVFPYNATVYVPAGYLDAYKNDSAWSQYDIRALDGSINSLTGNTEDYTGVNDKW